MRKKSKLYKFSFLIFIFILSTTCNRPHEIHETYMLFEEALKGENIDQILSFLDLPSSTYIEDILGCKDSFRNCNTPYKQNLDLTTEMFYHYLNRKQSKEERLISFFQLMRKRWIFPFYRDDDYQLVNDRSIVGEDNYIAMGVTKHNRRYLKWIRLNLEDGVYKIDLIFLLGLHEKETKLHFDNFIKHYPGMTDKLYRNKYIIMRIK